MKQAFREYTAIYRKMFTEYRGMLVVLALVCMLGFGFTITHHSIGVDNNAHDLYYLQGGVISQGRLTALVLDKVFGAYSYPPFWANAMGALVLYSSSLAWCALMMRVGEDKIGQAACLIFASVLISYPIINEHFIFNPLNLPLGYGLTAIALALGHEADVQRKIMPAVWGVLVMMFIISLNESFAAVFLIGTLCLFMLEILYANRVSQGGHWIKKVLVFLMILAAGIVVEWIVTAVVRAMYPSATVVGASNARILWFYQPAAQVIKNVFWGLVGKYIINAKIYFPIAVFLLASLVFTIAVVYLAFKRKKPVLILLAVGIFFSVVSVSVIKGAALPYRTDSALGFFTAFAVMLVWLVINKNWQKTLWILVVVLLVVNQTRVLNNWFVNDYMRYERDKEIAENVSLEIEKTCTASKPVLLIGWVDNSAATWNIAGEYNGIQFFNAYLNYREKPNEYSSLLIDFFKIHGHEFADATQTYYEVGREVAKDMPSYPKAGYIREEEAYIVVNFN